MGFVIRVIAGAIILGVPISIWLYLCTGLGALILAFSKRRVELIFGGDQSLEYRSVFKYYSLRMIDYFIWVVSASLVLSYSIYSYSASNLPDNRFMLITIPLAIFGIFRFLVACGPNVDMTPLGGHADRLTVTNLKCVFHPESISEFI